MTLKANRGSTPCGCGCDGNPVANTYSLRVNLSSTESRREVFKGVDHLVVPLVMLRETVVNGGLVLLSELKPQGWNGVPVTIGHPEVNGKPVSANTPKVLEQWQVGHIFNAWTDADKLKAEAWLDIEKTEAFRPGLVATLEGGAEMDVSTGYYSTDVPELGEHKGKPYFEVHKDLKPDHLALLPDEEGACNWEDGCGVRVNKEKNMSDKDDKPQDVSPEMMAGVARFFKTFGRQNPKTNLRGDDDDFRQMVADLISNDSSPFVPDDEYALREMSYDTVMAMRDQYVKNNTAEEGTDPVTDNKTEKVAPVTAAEVADIVANALKTHTDDTKKLVDDAVETAMNANERAALVDEIHEATEVEKEELQKLSMNALRAMKPKTNAGGKADMSGRGMKTNGDDGSGKVKTFPGMNTNAAAKEAAKDKKEA